MHGYSHCCYIFIKKKNNASKTYTLLYVFSHKSWWSFVQIVPMEVCVRPAGISQFMLQISPYLELITTPLTCRMTKFLVWLSNQNSWPIAEKSRKCLAVINWTKQSPKNLTTKTWITITTTITIHYQPPLLVSPVTMRIRIAFASSKFLSTQLAVPKLFSFADGLFFAVCIKRKPWWLTESFCSICGPVPVVCLSGVCQHQDWV